MLRSEGGAVKTIDVSERYFARGRVTFREPVRKADDTLVPSLYAQCWTMVTQEDLKLPTWIGIGDRPRLSCFWCALDAEGRILHLIPAENVAAFSADPEPS